VIKSCVLSPNGIVIADNFNEIGILRQKVGKRCFDSKTVESGKKGALIVNSLRLQTEENKRFYWKLESLIITNNSLNVMKT